MTLSELGQYLEASVQEIDEAKADKAEAEELATQEIGAVEAELKRVQEEHAKIISAIAAKHDSAVQKVASLRQQFNAELDKIAGGSARVR